jgi:hypothetical protein
MTNPYPSDNPDWYTGANFSGVEFANQTFTSVGYQVLSSAYVGFTPSVTFQIQIVSTHPWEVDLYWRTAPSGAFSTYGSQSYSGKGNCSIVDTVPTLAAYWEVDFTNIGAGSATSVTIYASSSQQGGRGATWGPGTYLSIPGDVAAAGTTYAVAAPLYSPGTYIVHYAALNALTGTAQLVGINNFGTVVVYWSTVNPAAGFTTNTITGVGLVQPWWEIVNTGASNHNFSMSLVRGY